MFLARDLAHQYHTAPVCLTPWRAVDAVQLQLGTSKYIIAIVGRTEDDVRGDVGDTDEDGEQATQANEPIQIGGP